MHRFLATIAPYPRIQRRAHRKLDQVVGKLGTAQFSAQEYVCKDYFNPKGTVVVCSSTSSMHHDLMRYSNPEEFDVSQACDVTDALGF